LQDDGGRHGVVGRIGPQDALRFQAGTALVDHHHRQSVPSLELTGKTPTLLRRGLTKQSLPEGTEGRPGARWTPPEPGRRGPGRPVGRGQGRRSGGELLFPWRHGWRVASGEHGEPLDSPVTGIVREVIPGVHIIVRAAGRAVRGIVALGGAARGRLQLAAGPSGELRPGGLDVGLADTILVVGARVDAETLTRARAMGVRGIVVAGLSSKERRDFLASEARQRAALHRLPPFAVASEPPPEGLVTAAVPAVARFKLPPVWLPGAVPSPLAEQPQAAAEQATPEGADDRADFGRVRNAKTRDVIAEPHSSQ